MRCYVWRRGARDSSDEVVHVAAVVGGLCRLVSRMGGVMALQVTVERPLLRGGLLELYAVESAAVHEALSGEQHVRLGRAHGVRAEAAARLLDEIGWLAPEESEDPEVPYELDIAAHGWAATMGLRWLAERERQKAVEYGEVEDKAEAAGAAGGRRLDILAELEQMEAACVTADFWIREPRPAWE